MFNWYESKEDPANVMKRETLRRGMKAMLIAGHPDYAVLERFKGQENKLFGLIQKKLAPKELTFAYHRARKYGDILYRTDFEITQNTPTVPKKYERAGLSRQVILLIAKCRALNLPEPDLRGVPVTVFQRAVELNSIFARLTQDSSVFVMDYRINNQSAHINALSLLYKDLGHLSSRDSRDDRSATQEPTSILHR
jgi:hypothetical protein